MRKFAAPFFHFRIHAAGDPEQIGQAIVIQIDDARAPADEARFHA